MALSFDEQREANIRKNKELLELLGISQNTVVVRKPNATVPNAQSKKRKAEEAPKAESEIPAEKLRVVENESEGDKSGPRRSGRNAGKKLDYSDGGEKVEKKGAAPKVLTEAAKKQMESDPRSVKDRTQNPKVFGAIPGVAVGTWWETRKDCSLDAIHAPWVAGISGGPGGCYSVALSGGYEDDVDLGEAFTYTGSGGRDLKGTKNNPKNLRTAPQSFDQTFDTKDNCSLLVSVETGKPVRVIRGYKLKSPYAPIEGYRYDGLYTVVKAWQDRGLNDKGYLVCKFAFKRLPGQPPLPVYEDDDENYGKEDSAEEE